MNGGTSLPLHKWELVALFLFSCVLTFVLLRTTGEVGYDLFWEQMGATILLYITILAGVSSIMKRGVGLVSFFQIFLIFSLVFFPYLASTKMDHPPRTLDNFETGTGSWCRLAAPGVNSTISEQVRLSPEGSWHMVWTVENACSYAPTGSWAAIEMACGANTFSAKDYKSIDFFYKTENGEYGFLAQLRAPDENNSFYCILGPSSQWTKVSLRLPSGNSLGNFSGNFSSHTDWTRCHVLFSNDCNETYHFDNMVLTSTTFAEQQGLLAIFGIEFGLGGLWILTSSASYFRSKKGSKRKRRDHGFSKRALHCRPSETLRSFFSIAGLFCRMIFFNSLR